MIAKPTGKGFFDVKSFLEMFLQRITRRSVGRLAVLQAVIATSSWRRNDLDVASDTVALC